MTILQAAILSLLTGLIGAIFGHLLSERKSRRDELAGMQLCAYSDFLKAISYLVSYRRIGHSDDDLSDLAVLNDAKARICVFANGAVVGALENFWLQGGTLEREQEIVNAHIVLLQHHCWPGFEATDVTRQHISKARI